MRRRRAPAVLDPPRPWPWQAVLLSVDTATRSGWAVTLAGETLAYGEADTLDEQSLSDIVRFAQSTAERWDVPTVLVLEAPWGGRRNFLATLMALGAARERWMRAWRAAGLPVSRAVRVKPNVWRRVALGKAYAGAKREVVRAGEQEVASHMAGEPMRAEEAAALLISVWAERSEEVGRVIGARARSASEHRWHGFEASDAEGI